MKLLTRSPARRLVVASTSAVVFHAAVFGAIEWNLSQNESRPAEESALLSVAVTMQEAPQPSKEPATRNQQEPQPEIPRTSSEPEEVDDEKDSDPDMIAAAAHEFLADSTTPPVSEAAAAVETVPAPNAGAGAQRSDAERETATTPRPIRPSEDEMVPAALQRSADAYRHAAPISTPPTLEPVRYTPPRYPETARRRGLTGTVVVEATIGRRGRVASVRVLDSSGVDSLDRAATRAVTTWRFTKSAEDQTSVHRIRFDLEEHR